MDEGKFPWTNGFQIGFTFGQQINSPRKRTGLFSAQHLDPIAEASLYRNLFCPNGRPIHPFRQSSQPQDNQSSPAPNQPQGWVEGASAGNGVINGLYPCGQNGPICGELINSAAA